MICSKTLFSGVLFFSVISGVLANDLSDLRGLVLNHAKIPIYDTKQNLQMMTFVDRAVRDGKILVGKNTVLEMVRKGSNVDNINDSWQLKYYSLDSKLPEVIKFWLPRLSYSDGVIITSQANIDQENNRAFGTAPVYFRSPMIDLEGIGFDVNFKKRTVQVNNDVNVVLRMASSDPRKLKLAGAEKIDYSFVRAYSDSLLIDIEHNQIMLVGSVKVVDRKSVLTCDRLTIFLDRDGVKGGTSGITAMEGDNNLSRILADGNVIITNSEGGNDQRVVSDHLVYDVKVGIFTFTGDIENPRFEQKKDIISGKRIVIYRDEQQVRISGNCLIRSVGDKGSVRQITADRGDIDFRINKGAFVGDVRMTDSGVVISGPYANLRLAAKAGKTVDVSSAASDRMLPGGFGTGGLGGSRELHSVEFTEGITVNNTSDQNSSGGLNLVADAGKYDAFGKFIDFEHDVKLLDSQMTLNAEKMRIMLDEKASPQAPGGGIDRIVCSDGVEIVGKGENAGTLTSQKGVFYYKKDLIVFSENVNLVNKKSKLVCDKLDLYLKSSQSAATSKQTGVVGVGGNDKVLTKAVATGEKVSMTDPQGNLVTEELTMLFEELPKGAKPVPGMLQSGNSRLVKVICDGGVRLESIPQKGAKNTAFGNSESNRIMVAKRSETDLKKNIAVLYDDVSVYDNASRIDCQKMSLFAVAPDKKTAKSADPDADPFALSANEDLVPQNIMLSQNLELKRVLCEKDVVMSSSDNGRKVAAGGDRGEFLSSARNFVITSTPPKRAWLSGEGKRQLCDKIVCDLENDRIYGVGSTETDKDFSELRKF